MEQFIDLKLVKDFNSSVGCGGSFEQQLPECFGNDMKAYSHKYMLKFAVNLTRFLEKEKCFLEAIFDDPMMQGLRREMYEKLLARLLTDSKEKVISEFVHGLAFEQ